MIEVRDVHNQDTIILLGDEILKLDKILQVFGREKEEMLSLLFFAKRVEPKGYFNRGNLVAKALRSQDRLLKWRCFGRRAKLIKCYSELLRIMSKSDNISFDMVKYMNIVMSLPLRDLAA